jgi:flagellar biosynthesis anti-sigma factor FlgM
MRIDQFTPATEAVQSERVSGAPSKAGSTTKTNQTGQTGEATGVSLHYQNLQAKVENTPDIRQDRVSALQKSMQNGTYHVSNQDLANAMFNTMAQKS